MKRGNTALKRVVSVASVAAMAIAGAVLAAPAASAATAVPTATPANSLRATPLADAAYMTADGTKVTAKISTDRTYGDGTGNTANTGQVPTVQVGAANALLNGFQVLIPSASADAQYKFVLPAGINFAVTPAVTITPQPVRIASDYTATPIEIGLDSVASATSADANTGVTALTTGLTVSSDKNAMTVQVPALTGAAGYAWVLTAKNVRVNVTSDYSGASAPVTVSGLGDDGGTPPAFTTTVTSKTTVGYINGLRVTADGEYTVSGSNVVLPKVNVTELGVSSLADPASFSLKASADKADTAAVAFSNVDADVKITGSASLDLTAPATSTKAADLNTIAAVGTDPTKVERVTLAGLTLANVKSGADVKLSITPALPADEDAAGVSFTADQAASDVPSVTIKAGTPENRIAGSNRYATSADVALQFAKTGAFTGSAVVIANGTDLKDGADALSANFLAYAKGAPILLTDGANLADSTKDALTKLFKDSQSKITVYVMGKTDSVSTAVRDAVKAAIEATVDTGTVTVTQVAGDSRYETSAASAKEAGSSALSAYNLGDGFGYTAFLASGQVNADALAAGAISARAGVPVLLTTNGDELDAKVAAAITDLGITNVVVLGATDRVSDKVVDALKATGVSVTRVAGADRFATAVDVNKLAFKATNGFGMTLGGIAYLANGVDGFADALTVGPLAGANSSALLTVPATTLPSGTRDYLADNKGAIDDVLALGASDRISDNVIALAQAAAK